MHLQKAGKYIHKRRGNASTKEGGNASSKGGGNASSKSEGNASTKGGGNASTKSKGNESKIVSGPIHTKMWLDGIHKQWGEMHFTTVEGNASTIDGKKREYCSVHAQSMLLEGGGYMRQMK